MSHGSEAADAGAAPPATSNPPVASPVAAGAVVRVSSHVRARRSFEPTVIAGTCLSPGGAVVGLPTEPRDFVSAHNSPRNAISAQSQRIAAIVSANMGVVNTSSDDLGT